MSRRSAALVVLFAWVVAGCERTAPTPPAAEPTPPPSAPAGASPMHFVDVTTEAGLDVLQESGAAEVDHIIDSVGAGAAWLDYDGDGDLDLYLAQGATRGAPDAGPPDRLFRHDGVVDGVPRFTDVTREAGLGDRRWSFGVAVVDLEGDGDPDLYLANDGPNRLYVNDGDGTFRDVAPDAGVADPAWSTDAAWADVDLDGDLDLYVTNYVEFDFERYPARGERLAGGGPPCTWRGLHVFCGPRNLVPAADRFYRNEGDPDGDGVPRFVEATRESGFDPGEAWFALDAQFVDTDGDRAPELYVANDSVQNGYFVNDGAGRFEEQAIFAGVAYNDQGHEQAGMGIAVGDVDGDGRFDLAVTNFSHDHDTLYRNDADHLFSDVSYPSGLGAASFYALAWGNAFVDLDLDGDEELFVARGHVYPQVDSRDLGTRFRQRNALFLNDGGTLRDIAEHAGPGLAVIESSRGVVPADVDGDGDLDLLVTNLDAPPTLLRNDSPVGGWLAVRLRGPGANRDGIGALVTLVADGRTQRRQITRSASFAASTVPEAHFGLGASASIDRVSVDWTDGRRSDVTSVEPGRRITIEPPAR